jgi:hypothetical protein
LANALCIVEAGGGGGLIDAGADEEVVADFDGEEEACTWMSHFMNNFGERKATKKKFDLPQPCGCPC